MKPRLHTVMSLLVLLLTSAVFYLQSVTASDELPRSYLKIPLVSRERIPINRVLTYPDQYQMRAIRLTGTVTAMQTELITNWFVCGRAHERTILIVEDDSGEIEVVDQGSCGKNLSALKAPMVKVGEQIDLLVQIMVTKNPASREAVLEATIQFLDRVRY